jgi:hypothetical protein
MKRLPLMIAVLAIAVAAVSFGGRSSAAPPPASMDDIYAALRYENLRTETGVTTFVAGSQIRFNVDLVSHSHRPLVVPLNSDFGRDFYLLGVEQTWVLRVAGDHSLPLPRAARKGDWYATGGAIIVATELDKHNRFVYGQVFQRFLALDSTTGWPAGAYRYYVEYKPLNGGLNDVIQTVQIDFTLS